LAFVLIISGTCHGDDAVELAAGLMASGKYVSAEQVLREGLRGKGVLDEDRVGMVALLAEALCGEKKPGDGLKELAKLSAAEANDGRVALAKGKCFLALGKLDDAERAWAVLPGAGNEAVAIPGGFELAKLAFARKRWEECIGHCLRRARQRLGCPQGDRAGEAVVVDG